MQMFHLGIDVTKAKLDCALRRPDVNFTLPPSTFKQMEQKYAKDYAGDALYKKTIADAEDQLHRLSCFVAGTLVHTKKGLRPIEQIKVGDYVLSKPESGEGEACYKRVVKTFESDDQEVYYVSYHGEAGSGFLIVTGNHPFWVINSNDYGVDPEEHPGHEFDPINTWVRADHLSGEYGESLQLHDGRKVIVYLVRPILRMEISNMGWIVGSREMDPGYGHVVNFRGDRPEYCRGQIADAPGLAPIPLEGYSHRDDEYGIENYDWDDPLKRKVYNIEVEDNHTYFVGELGVWVHNTCKIDDLAGQKSAGAITEGHCAACLATIIRHNTAMPIARAVDMERLMRDLLIGCTTGFQVYFVPPCAI